MKNLSRWSVVALLVLGGLLAGCSDDSTDDESSDDSVLDVSTDDSVGDDDAGDDETTTTAAGGTGEQASDELCEATAQPPSDEAVSAFPEDLQDEAQAYVDALEEYEAAVDAGETPTEEETPVLDQQIQDLLATCP